MTEPEPERVIAVPRTDPIYQAWIWREDSRLLFRLRPILERLRYVQDQPCVLGETYACQVNGLTCSPCAIRQIRAELFGPWQPTKKEQPDVRDTDPTDRADGGDLDAE